MEKEVSKWGHRGVVSWQLVRISLNKRVCVRGVEGS